MNIPVYALPIFRDNWSGWTWLSIAPNGRIIRWLGFKRVGQSGATFIYFQFDNNYEQFVDWLDFDEQNNI